LEVYNEAILTSAPPPNPHIELGFQEVSKSRSTTRYIVAHTPEEHLTGTHSVSWTTFTFNSQSSDQIHSK